MNSELQHVISDEKFNATNWQESIIAISLENGTSPEPIVQLRDVNFSYNGQRVLEEISLSICPDDFMAVIGPNGGGKSTLLKLILGLLKPDRGEVRVMGCAPGVHTSSIGYVPQNVNINENFPITALDVVLMGALNRKNRGRVRKREITDKALSLLERLGMGGADQKKIGEMSGGQRQRVLIARSLMTRPKLLLLDEPTASIDTRGQTEFYSLLEELNREVAILVVSHDLFVISRYVKSVACVNKSLHYHPREEMTGTIIKNMYACSVEDDCRFQALARGLSRVEKGRPEEVSHGAV